MYEFPDRNRKRSSGVSLTVICRFVVWVGLAGRGIRVFIARCVSQATESERPAKRTLFDNSADSDDDAVPQNALAVAAVSPFLQILKNEGAMANIQEHVTESLNAKFASALGGSVSSDTYSSIAEDISEILEGVDPSDISTAVIFLSSFKDRAEKAATALGDIKRESFVEDLKAGQLRISKRCDDALVAAKKDYESKKKELVVKRDRDLTLLADKFRAEHPVRAFTSL
jgi:hypothetical protein